MYKNFYQHISSKSNAKGSSSDRREMVTGETWDIKDEGRATEMVNIDYSPLEFFKMFITIENKNYKTHRVFSICRCNTYDNYNIKETKQRDLRSGKVSPVDLKW